MKIGLAKKIGILSKNPVLKLKSLTYLLHFWEHKVAIANYNHFSRDPRHQLNKLGVKQIDTSNNTVNTLTSIFGLKCCGHNAILCCMTIHRFILIFILWSCNNLVSSIPICLNWHFFWHISKYELYIKWNSKYIWVPSSRNRALRARGDFAGEAKTEWCKFHYSKENKTGFQDMWKSQNILISPLALSSSTPELLKSKSLIEIGKWAGTKTFNASPEN